MEELVKRIAEVEAANDVLVQRLQRSIEGAPQSPKPAAEDDPAASDMGDMHEPRSDPQLKRVRPSIAICYLPRSHLQ